MSYYVKSIWKHIWETMLVELQFIKKGSNSIAFNDYLPSFIADGIIKYKTKNNKRVAPVRLCSVDIFFWFSYARGKYSSKSRPNDPFVLNRSVTYRAENKDNWGCVPMMAM